MAGKCKKLGLCVAYNTKGKCDNKHCKYKHEKLDPNQARKVSPRHTPRPSPREGTRKSKSPKNRQSTDGWSNKALVAARREYTQNNGVMRPCRHFTSGTCRHGDNCIFPHTSGPAKLSPKKAKALFSKASGFFGVAMEKTDDNGVIQELDHEDEKVDENLTEGSRPSLADSSSSAVNEGTEGEGDDSSSDHSTEQEQEGPP